VLRRESRLAKYPLSCCLCCCLFGSVEISGNGISEQAGFEVKMLGKLKQREELVGRSKAKIVIMARR
jgi:hypothetical protein